MVSSVDNSYRRDKELLYTIGDRSISVYMGRSVTEEEWRNSFDSLSDERIKRMSKQSASKDYIFCSHCEKKLGNYLESPWHNHMFKGKTISPILSYFFWVSLLWRISAFEGLSFKLPTHIEKGLGKRLNEFIQLMDNKEELSPLMNKAPFVYKVLYCKDYSKEHPGFIFYEYDSKRKIATLLLGDVATCFSFHKHGSFFGHSFYGLEQAFTKAPVNDGSTSEQVISISASKLNNVGSNIVSKLQAIKKEVDRENVIRMWQLVRNKIPFLPSIPTEDFVSYVLYELYDDSEKTGERTTQEYFAKCFRKGLERLYNIPILHSLWP